MLTQRALFRIFVTFILLLSGSVTVFAQKRAMTFEDVMKFRALNNPTFSDNGKWVAYVSSPDRGDGHGEVRSTDGRTTYTVERGASPQISPDGAWAAFTVLGPAADMEDPAKRDSRPRNGLALISTRDGAVTSFEEVNRFSLSDDGKWLIRLHMEPKGNRRHEGGTDLVIRNLATANETTIPFVKSFQMDSTSSWLVFTTADTAKVNGLYALDLRVATPEPARLDTATEGSISMPVWHNASGRMAWLSARQAADKKPGPATVKIWDAGSKAVRPVVPESMPDGWEIPADNSLRWTSDGERIFLGVRHTPVRTPADTSKKPFDLFDFDDLLEKRELDVWHWNDPVIATQQKARWRQEQSRTWQAVYHIGQNRLVQLSDETLPSVQFTDNPARAIGTDNREYARLTTWDGNYNDVYSVDLTTGARKLLLTKHSGGVNLSPTGNHGVFFRDQQWHVIYMPTGVVREVSSGAGVVFYNEATDTPGTPGAYGFAGWVEGEKAFRVYDRTDIWEIDLSGKGHKNVTKGQGREKNITFRVQNTDGMRAAEYAPASSPIILSGYDNARKSQGYYRLNPANGTIETLIDENRRVTFVTKIKETGQMVYSRQTTHEFPDLWLADAHFKNGKKVTEFGKQLDAFWTGRSELVQWSDLNGNPLEGVLIKPENYEDGKRYPVIVYYYELSNQRLHEFNQTVVNHRPSFNYYLSNGYVLFLPDVKYTIGLPGYSATRSLVPGVQKIIDMGVADPNAIGLHGHSWSGYQTLHVITQTDIFACAIAGAPVSNMTSAYSGIRWGAGVARQFQYEKGQSRIGGSMWELPEKYIENSPVFFADRINTPLLIQHGDADEAVPWYQSIEMYLAMRRLDKDAVFLQYRDEPHHLRKYANKLDYSIRMAEYFDHYLKGKPAAAWITDGEPYQGR